MGKKESTLNKLQQMVFLQDSDQIFFCEQYIKSPKNPSRRTPLKTGLKILNHFLSFSRFFCLLNTNTTYLFMNSISKVLRYPCWGIPSKPQLNCKFIDIRHISPSNLGINLKLIATKNVLQFPDQNIFMNNISEVPWRGTPPKIHLKLK